MSVYKDLRSEAESNIYGVIIRPTLKACVRAVQEDVVCLQTIYDRFLKEQKLQAVTEWVIEKGTHLHSTIRSPIKLRYKDIAKQYPGWHIYLREKRGLELKIWKNYIQKDLILDEYAFRDQAAQAPGAESEESDNETQLSRKA